MKEFAMRHPILTFLLVDSAIGGVVKIVTSITGAFGRNDEEAETTIEVTKEETPDGPSGDIQ